MPWPGIARVGPPDQVSQRSAPGRHRIGHGGEGEHEFPTHPGVGHRPAGEDEDHIPGHRAFPEHHTLGTAATGLQPAACGLGAGSVLLALGGQDDHPGRTVGRLPSGGQRGPHLGTGATGVDA